MSSDDEPARKPVISDKLSNTSGCASLGRALQEAQSATDRINSVIEPCRSFLYEPPISSVLQIGKMYSSLVQIPEMARIGAVAEHFKTTPLHSFIGELQKSPLMEAAQRVGAIGAAYQEQIDRMQLPAARLGNIVEAIGGIIKLQTIGELVRMPTSYDPDVSHALRDEFGDWRDPMSFQEYPEGSRADFYQSVGFDEELIEFSDEDFPQVIEQTSIVRPTSEIEALLGPFSDGYAAQFVPGNHELQAFNWLHTLERAIRYTLDRIMTEAYGPKWPKARLPNGMHDDWQSKKAKAGLVGQPGQSLIEFADFTDYLGIIVRRDNWREVFSAFWPREQDVRESFQRLHYIRIETMHNRVLLKQDLVLLYSEGRRLLEALAQYHARH